MCLFIFSICKLGCMGGLVVYMNACVHICISVCGVVS